MKFYTWLKRAAAIAIVAAFCGQAQAANDPITVWGFEVNTPPDLTDSAASPSALADVGTGTATGLHASATTDWTTPAGNGSANSFSSNGWAVGDYYQFQTSTTGVTNTNIGLIFDHVSSSTGPRDFQVSYSTDGTSYTNFGLPYSVRVNNSPAWSSAGAIVDLDTYEVDLTSISALDNAANVYFRLTVSSATSASGGTIASTGTSRIDNFQVVKDFVAPPPPPPPEVPIAGDLVLGLGAGTASITTELVRGGAVLDGGVKRGSPWTSNTFIRSVEFDNKGGTLHNVEGNLLGVDEGTIANGGTVYSFATQGTPPFPAGQAIANTRLDPNDIGQDGVGGVTLSRLSGLSVAPDNSKVAVAGMDTGRVLVYDYTAGDSLGAGASAANGRQTSQILAPFVPDDPGQVGDQSQTYRYGTAWRDNNTVLSLNRDGSLYSVNATTMATTLATTLGVPGIGSEHTALAYNPDVTPDYVYAMYSGFNSAADPQSRSRLFVLDADDYSLVSQTDLTDLDLSGDTAREIALDADGNLFLGTFGSDVFFIPDVVTNAASPGAPVHWYAGSTFSSFNGLDIGFAPPDEGDADYNEDGTIDAADYVAWNKLGINGEAGYTLWKQQFGQSSPGGGSAGGVPEPAGFVTLAIGLATLCFRRRIG